MKDWGGGEYKTRSAGTSVSLGKLPFFEGEDRLFLEGFSFPQTPPQRHLPPLLLSGDGLQWWVARPGRTDARESPSLV